MASDLEIVCSQGIGLLWNDFARVHQSWKQLNTCKIVNWSFIIGCDPTYA